MRGARSARGATAAGLMSDAGWLFNRGFPVYEFGVSGPLSDADALSWATASPSQIVSLMERAATVRDRAWGQTLTYSPKVFLPITNLCRNRCEYCAFRRSSGDAGEWTMSPADIAGSLSVAREQGCVEALLCLGDTPETAFPEYRKTLASFGHERTVDYLEWACRQALHWGLLPHTNAGILSLSDMQRLKPVNVSLGLMLENVSPRLSTKGMAHYRAPDKRPAPRLRMLREAGELSIPFTTGILIGIGETREERIQALLAIRELHREFGHVQEVIVQNFTPHATTPMAFREEPSADEMAHSVALARLILPGDVSVQAPPNLNPDRTALLVNAGINDFGGISPVTPDYINPDRPWPYVAELGSVVRGLGYELRPRLPVYDSYVSRPGFLDSRLRLPVRRAQERIGAS
jgi:7,8-didemethyl-8-hydroxy-5-deazariboflavin synthase CofG subunit